MKTYLLDSFNRYKRFSEELDARTILCNKSWKVFNDTGVKELFIFQEDGTLIISQDGIVTNAVWKYIAANRGIIISTKNESYLLHPAFADNNIFALQQDGTQLCLFMVDEQSTFSPLSLADLNNYFKKKNLIEEEKYQKAQDLEKEEEIRKIKLQKKYNLRKRHYKAIGLQRMIIEM